MAFAVSGNSIFIENIFEVLDSHIVFYEIIVNLGQSVICYSHIIFIIKFDVTFIIMIAYYVACGANIDRAPYLNKFFKA